MNPDCTEGISIGSRHKFVGHILCRCGALADLWLDGKRLLTFCEECKEIRSMDLEEVGISEMLKVE